MDLKSPSFLLSLPFALMALAALLFRNVNYAIFFMIAGLVGLSLVFVFRQPIHWYWYIKNPPPIEPEMIAILERKMPYYQRLSTDNKRLFLRRMSLFLMAKEFEAITEGGTVPADVKGLIAATGVQICFGKTRFLMPDFQKVIIHPSLFLSAEVKQFHGSETFIDPEYKRHSCLIFAADRLIHAFDSPKSGYNTTLHEFGNVFKFKFDLDDLVGNLEKDPLFDKKLQVIRGFTVQQALDYTKNPTLSTFGTLIEHFFFNPTAFKSLLPELYQQLCALLNQDPINASNPVIEPIDYDLLLEKKEIF